MEQLRKRERQDRRLIYFILLWLFAMSLYVGIKHW